MAAVNTKELESDLYAQGVAERDRVQYLICGELDKIRPDWLMRDFRELQEKLVGSFLAGFSVTK